MTRLRRVIFVCVGAGLGASGAGAGCSSSSNPAGPGIDAATEANVEVTPDGATLDGAATTVTIQWTVVGAAPGNTGVIEGGASDGGVDESGADGGAGESGVGDASAADAATSDGNAGAAEGGSDAGVLADASGDAAATTSPPLPGVMVCVYQNNAIPCVTTQSDGSFTFPGLPVRTALTLSLVKAGYGSGLVPIETASTDSDVRGGTPITMYPVGPADAGGPNIGVPVDFANHGEIIAFAVTGEGSNQTVFPGTLGTKIALNPASGNGPYYLNDANEIVLSATSVAGSGGGALYYNVDPGKYTLTFTNPGYDCEPISFPFGQFGIPLTTPAHSVQAVVAAGFVTGFVGVLCTANPVIVAVDGG